MPKAASSSTSSNAVSPAAPYGGSNNPNVLKRNQACHQCRRRKLKCDAKRPCTTCVRSHKNAVKSLAPGSDIPPIDCTFDEVEAAAATVHVAPKNRYERLESRINELETLLRQKEQSDAESLTAEGSRANSTQAGMSTNPPQPPATSISYDPFAFPPPQNASSSSMPNGHITVIDESMQGIQNINGSSSIDATPATTFSMGTPQFSAAESIDRISPTIPAHIATVSTPADNVSPPDSSTGNTVLWSSWPEHLPAPALLQHLVNAFFGFHPYSSRMFHTASFMASLALPPNHPNFPPSCVLHAICAVGSCYTAAVKQPPMPNYNMMQPDEIFPNRTRRFQPRNESFGEKHYRLASHEIDECTLLGEYLVETIQSLVLLAWYAHFHARWSDVFLLAGRAVRALVPLGLNMCPPFHSISPSLRAPSILPPARTVIEDELRRNVFWCAYAMERLNSTGNGWAMSLDDQDVSQLMPVTMEDFTKGNLVSPDKRQWAHGPNVLFLHPADQTDSFVLFIKSTVVLSRVKAFNLRFRTKNYAGDPMMHSPPDKDDPENTNPAWIDPRETQGFKEIDHLVNTFHDTFPRGMRVPIQENIIDQHLLSACLAPLVGSILLHDPHADVRYKGCRSAQRILKAARSILDYTYTLWSSSFDLGLVDNYFVFSWFMTGRVLTRFQKAAKDIDDQGLFMQYGTELEFIRIVLAKTGERVPLASRYSKMLDDLIVRIVGPTEKLILYNTMPKLLDHNDTSPQREGFLQDITMNAYDKMQNHPQLPPPYS